MPILTQNEIKNLHARYINVVNFINEQNLNQPNGHRIKQVQLPSSLTQSIAYHFIINNPNIIGQENITLNNFREGNNRTYDLIYELDNDVINIEVKATGTDIFQRFRPHALTAHFVIWLNFNENFYDIAVFSPNILTPNNNGEVDISWTTLMESNNITLIQNNEI
jgi:hypothetical protein